MPLRHIWGQPPLSPNATNFLLAFSVGLSSWTQKMYFKFTWGKISRCGELRSVRHKGIKFLAGVGMVGVLAGCDRGRTFPWLYQREWNKTRRCRRKEFTLPPCFLENWIFYLQRHSRFLVETRNSDWKLFLSLSVTQEEVRCWLARRAGGVFYYSPSGVWRVAVKEWIPAGATVWPVHAVPSSEENLNLIFFHCEAFLGRSRQNLSWTACANAHLQLDLGKQPCVWPVLGERSSSWESSSCQSV